jgi:Spy/CpxP family protein refolding chaperone
MSRKLRHLALAVTLTLLATSADAVQAQQGGQGRGRWGLMFTLPRVTLAQLDEVRAELKLSDEHQQQIEDLNDELAEGLRTAFQDAGGDWDKMREAMNKRQKEVNDKLDKLLDPAQRKRIQEVYIQVNGAGALQDEAVAKALQLTGEQEEKLEEVREASRDEFMNAGLRDLDDEERAKKIDELTKSRDDKAMAVLTEEQRADFNEMKGEELKVDLSKLPAFGRGGGEQRRDTT